ncbi:hypothetical protein HPB51_004786 [Rhipicephalus microplus]|uniref:Ig-like domain-containing protein n=1 Tax=Rhipicephalus microplus TaxID=6941 RepID=A0A9J6E6T2_RHIMP|nr:hypothetical protein HPB51_004786 [Rhipicephalus microplus]
MRVFSDNAPKIQAFSFSPDLSMGDAAVVICAVKKGSRGPHTLSWLKDSRRLSEDHRVSVFRQSDMLCTLTIRDVGPDDVGNYSCVARNARGEDTFTAPLAVSDTGHSNRRVFQGRPRCRSSSLLAFSPLGDTAIVSCVVRKGSRGPYKLAWFKNGQELDAAANGNVLVSNQGDSISTLTLKDIAVEDNGNYTCVATNVAGSDEASAFLTVTGSPKIQAFSFSPDLSLSDTTMIMCAIKSGSRGPHDLSWFKDSLPIINQKRVTVTRQSDTLSTLHSAELEARRLRQLHKIDYARTIAMTRALQASSTALVLICIVVFWFTGSTAHEPPVLQEFSFAKNSFMGGTAVVPCVAISGTRPMGFTWFHDGVPVSSGGGGATVSNVAGNVAMLTIERVSPASVGNYTCVARNVAGTAAVWATLYVQAAPVWSAEPSDAEAIQGKNLYLPCGAVGYPKPSVVWKIQLGNRELVPLHPVGRQRILDNGTLVVAAVETQDAGVYRCEVGNGIEPSLGKTVTVSVHGEAPHDASLRRLF